MATWFLSDIFIFVEVLLAVGLVFVLAATTRFRTGTGSTCRNKGVWMWVLASDPDMLAEMLDVLDDEPFQVIPGANNGYVLMARVYWEMRRKLQRRVEITARSARRGK